MIILGIETSCDDTAAAVVKDGRTVLSSVTSSQDQFHKKYGGVVPEIASRKHLETINLVIQEALEKAGHVFKEIDAIAVTQGPGLVGSLLIGIMTAKALAYVYKKPLIAVNHLEGHIFSCLLGRKNLKPPFLSLIISGGHSDLVYVRAYGVYEMLGRTRDDAVGETYDKVAKILGLGYPGGPVIDRLARDGNTEAVKFPKAKMKDNSLDFSFSGVKTAVINHIRNTGSKNSAGKQSREKAGSLLFKHLDKKTMLDIIASFQKTVVETLLDNTMIAAKKMRAKTVTVCGGVSANSYLRKKFTGAFNAEGTKLYFPEMEYCTDNAAMIACAGYYSPVRKKLKPISPIAPLANMEL